MPTGRMQGGQVSQLLRTEGIPGTWDFHFLLLLLFLFHIFLGTFSFKTGTVLGKWDLLLITGLSHLTACSSVKKRNASSKGELSEVPVPLWCPMSYLFYHLSTGWERTALGLDIFLLWMQIFPRKPGIWDNVCVSEAGPDLQAAPWTWTWPELLPWSPAVLPITTPAIASPSQRIPKIRFRSWNSSPLNSEIFYPGGGIFLLMKCAVGFRLSLGTSLYCFADTFLFSSENRKQI